MKSLKIVAGLALAMVAGGAGAALTKPVKITFSNLPEAVYGRPNLAPAAGGACPNGVACYQEGGVYFGAPYDPTPFFGAGAHIHAVAYAAGKKGLEYDADSSGIYVRMKDSSTFNVNSLYFNAPITPENPDKGANDVWLIVGYKTAINPTLTTEKSNPNVVATYTVKNGFKGTVTLPGTFHNIKAMWIYYKGYPSVPTDPDAVLDPDTGEVLSDGPLSAKAFNVAIDDVALAPPLTAAQKVECLFNWFEKNATYAPLFKPAGQTTAQDANYWFRYYSMTGYYLSLSKKNSRVYYRKGVAGTLKDLGTQASWLVKSNCQ